MPQFLAWFSGAFLLKRSRHHARRVASLERGADRALREGDAGCIDRAARIGHSGYTGIVLAEVGNRGSPKKRLNRIRFPIGFSDACLCCYFDRFAFTHGECSRAGGL